MVCSLSTGCVIDEETDYLGHDIEGGKKVKNQQACATLTGTIVGGLFWTYRTSDKKCWIKTSKKGKKAHAGLVSGSIGCAQNKTDTWQECQRRCTEIEQCKGFTWHKKNNRYSKFCSLFSTYNGKIGGQSTVSGLKECQKDKSKPSPSLSGQVCGKKH